MKRFVVAIALLLTLGATCASAAFARITGGQQTVAGGSTVAATFTTGATNRIILVVAGSAATTSTFSIADTAGNSWTTLNARTTQTGSGAMQSWWALSNGTGSTTVTVTVGTTACNISFFCNILADVFSGNATTSPVSGINTAGGASGAPSGTVTPADANCLIWGGANDSITAVGAGYTKGADDAAQDWTEFQEIAGGSGAAQTVNFTGASGAWLMHMAAIKPTGGAAACTPTLSLMGVGRCGD